MAVGDLNLNDVITNIPPDLLQNLGPLITILQAAGIIFIIYIIILIVNLSLSIRRSVLIKRIYLKIYEIELKLDQVLNKKNKVNTHDTNIKEKVHNKEKTNNKTKNKHKKKT